MGIGYGTGHGGGVVWARGVSMAEECGSGTGEHGAPGAALPRLDLSNCSLQTLPSAFSEAAAAVVL